MSRVVFFCSCKNLGIFYKLLKIPHQNCHSVMYNGDFFKSKSQICIHYMHVQKYVCAYIHMYVCKERGWGLRLVEEGAVCTGSKGIL